MRNQVWLGMAAFVGLSLSGAAMAQQAPVIFGKPVPQQPAQTQQQQGTRPGPIIFGKQTRVPANTPQTGTNSPVYRREADRNRDRDRAWRREHYRRTHAQNTPPGWRKGRKTGWGGCDVPPGQAKKVGCTPGRGWRDHDRDRDGRGHGRGRK